MRKRGAQKVIVAAPVASNEAVARVRRVAELPQVTTEQVLAWIKPAETWTKKVGALCVVEFWEGYLRDPLRHLLGVGLPKLRSSVRQDPE